MDHDLAFGHGVGIGVRVAGPDAVQQPLPCAAVLGRGLGWREPVDVPDVILAWEPVGDHIAVGQAVVEGQGDQDLAPADIGIEQVAGPVRMERLVRLIVGAVGIGVMLAQQRARRAEAGPAVEAGDVDILIGGRSGAGAGDLAG